MGLPLSIPQPKYAIDAIGHSFRVTRDDVVQPVGYFVGHGISSLTVATMHLQTADGRILPVAVDGSDRERLDPYYFVAEHEGGLGLPTYDSTAGHYPYSAEARAPGGRPYPLQLRYTPRLELINK